MQRGICLLSFFPKFKIAPYKTLTLCAIILVEGRAPQQRAEDDARHIIPDKIHWNKDSVTEGAFPICVQ
ncbi:hypothetical protein CL176_02920 [Suicoccus acidiformans]|uniref:Uncharacterized protein n=1 Tax=Suicoccus acidiformans TaxID=2036206 RepID=A0A347WJ07_9LACT|nr:hypothetical protein CL176_02920 [Suicoccus acidiformans]